MFTASNIARRAAPRKGKTLKVPVLDRSPAPMRGVVKYEDAPVVPDTMMDPKTETFKTRNPDYVASEFREPEPEDMAPVGKAMTRKESFWNKQRHQPINPLMLPKPKQPPPRQTATKGTWSVRSQEIRKMRYTDDQIDAIMDAYANQHWYAPIWNALKWLPHQKLMAIRRWCHLGIIFFSCQMFGVIYFFYHGEMDAFGQMDADDQRDWKKVVMNARMGRDVLPIMHEVLDRVDPLRVLPVRDQMHHIVQELRKRGLVDCDWELEKRKRDNLLRDPDFYHMFFWMYMYMGKVLIGGGIFWWDIEDIGITPEQAAERRASPEYQNALEHGKKWSTSL